MRFTCFQRLCLRPLLSLWQSFLRPHYTRAIFLWFCFLISLPLHMGLGLLFRHLFFCLLHQLLRADWSSPLYWPVFDHLLDCSLINLILRGKPLSMWVCLSLDTHMIYWNLEPGYWLITLNYMGGCTISVWLHSASLLATHEIECWFFFALYYLRCAIRLLTMAWQIDSTCGEEMVNTLVCAMQQKLLE